MFGIFRRYLAVRSGRPLTRKVALVLGSMVFTFALLEIMVRSFAPHPFYQRPMIPDERMGFILKPDIKLLATNPKGEFRTILQTNREGFRDSNHSITKASGVFRIAFLGDSFTQAEQVEEKDCFVRQVEKALNDAGSMLQKAKSVECLNFGIDGFGTQQELLCYENYVRKYKPDLVVLMIYGHNDFIENGFYLFEEGFGRPYFRMSKGSLEWVPANTEALQRNYLEVKAKENRWLNKWQTLNAVKYLARSIIKSRKQRAEIASLQRVDAIENQLEAWKIFDYRKYLYFAAPQKNPILGEIQQVTSLLLGKLRSEIEEDGARLCVVFLPGEESLWPERWGERQKYLPGMEHFTMNFDRPVEEISSAFPDLVKKGDMLNPSTNLLAFAQTGDIFFRNDFHYTILGHSALTQALVPWLKQKLCPCPSDGEFSRTENQGSQQNCARSACPCPRCES